MTTLLKQVIETDPVAPRLLNSSISRDLETICLKCLEKEPSRRYATATALAEDLGRYLESKPIEARPVGAVGKAWKWCRRKPALAAALATVVLVAAAGFAGIVWEWQRAELQRRIAQRNELLARQVAYAVEMSSAQRALASENVSLAKNLLHRYRPTLGRSEIRSQKTAVDLRGWEWRYLWQLCQPDESVALDPHASSVGQAVISQNGRVLAVQTGADHVVLCDLISRKRRAELPNSPTTKPPSVSGLLARRAHAGFFKF